MLHQGHGFPLVPIGDVRGMGPDEQEDEANEQHRNEAHDACHNRYEWAAALLYGWWISWRFTVMREKLRAETRARLRAVKRCDAALRQRSRHPPSVGSLRR